MAGGVLAALIVWTATNRFGVSRVTAYVTTAVFALAPPLVIYSTQVYPEVMAGLAVLAGFAAILGPFSRRGRIVFAIAVIVLPWLAVKYVPVAAVLAVAGLVKAGRGRRRSLLMTFAAAAIVYVFGHLAIYDGLTAYATGDHFVGGEFTAVGSEVNLWGRSIRLIGLLVDSGFGIAAWQPAFFVLPVVAGWALARRDSRYAMAGWLMATGWLVATFVALTMHGWWFPGRQLVVVLPVAIVMVAAWADETRRSLAVLAAGGILGLAAYWYLVGEGLAGRLTWVVDFGATANPFYRVLAAALPDYMTPSTGTWVLHGIWVAIAAALVWWGWRTGVKPWDETRNSAIDSKRERVLT